MKSILNKTRGPLTIRLSQGKVALLKFMWVRNWLKGLQEAQ